MSYHTTGKQQKLFKETRMTTYRITVLGAGNIGGTLGRKWVAAGHQVAFGVSNPESAKVQAIRNDLGDKITIGSVDAVLADADIVVFAIPADTMQDTIAANATALDGKVIIDATNRMGSATTNSLAIFQQLTPQARVHRAFNTVTWEVLANPEINGVQSDLFYAGGDAERAMMEQLIGEIGLRPIYVGDTDQFAVVDAFLSLFFAVGIKQGHGRHISFKLLS